MIEQIKILESFKETFSGNDNINAIDIAINSLQAWSEVLNELETEKNKSYENGGFNFTGLKRAIDIIKQHLAEIEE